MAKQKKSGCGVFILIMAFLFLLGGGAVFVFESYQKQQKKIAKEISELPAFDKEKAEKEAARELKLELPVASPNKTEEEIKEQAEKELKELAKKKVPSTFLSIKTRDILKKYRPAKEGEPVSFLNITTGKTIKGPFKGTSADNKGKYIKIGWNKYRLYDIDEDRMFLFDSVIAQKRASSELNGLKKEFKEKRKNAINENREKVQGKIYLESGYRQLDGNWTPNATVLAAKIEDKEREHRRSQKSEIRKIFERNKLFGLINVNPAEESNKSDGEDDFFEEDLKTEKAEEKISKKPTTSKNTTKKLKKQKKLKRQWWIYGVALEERVAPKKNIYTLAMNFTSPDKNFINNLKQEDWIVKENADFPVMVFMMDFWEKDKLGKNLIGRQVKFMGVGDDANDFLRNTSVRLKGDKSGVTLGDFVKVKNGKVYVTFCSRCGTALKSTKQKKCETCGAKIFNK